MKQDSLQISVEVCRGWSSDGSKCDKPGSLRAQCPFCGDWCAFLIQNFQLNQPGRIATANSTCPSCEGIPKFVFLYGEAENALAGSRPLSIRMFPARRLNYDMPELPGTLPEPLRRSMESTVQAYNARIYDATATSGRRTLEGIFKYMVSEEKRDQSLYKLMKEVENNYDFSEPVRRLSNAIRTGGNLGAHFDLQNEADAEMARQLVELLDYLISYLYVLPSQIDALEESIGRNSRISASRE